MSYATAGDLDRWAGFHDLEVPSDEEHVELLLGLSTGDVIRHLGARWDLDDLEADQVAALRDGTCAQACFRLAQGPEHFMGVDDGVASVAGLSFSTRTAPRFSPQAAELLAGFGLYVRSHTVETVEVEVVDVQP